MLVQPIEGRNDLEKGFNNSIAFSLRLSGVLILSWKQIGMGFTLKCLRIKCNLHLRTYLTPCLMLVLWCPKCLLLPLVLLIIPIQAEF